MKRKILSIVLFIVLLASFFSFPTTPVSAAWDGTSASIDWSGNGTAGDPYIISTPAQLKGLANQVNGGTSYSGYYFKLDADIDLGSYAWAPIGGACTLTAKEEGVPTGYYFAGIFDGDNHTISNINISNPASDTGAYGLFGYVNSGIIANLNVSGSLNMGTSSISLIGSVVGYTTGSLYNLHSSMNVYMNESADSDDTYTASQCGGIAGAVNNTSSTALYVRYCSNTGNVTGRGRVGGIAGAVYCVTNGGVVVDQCCNTGDLTSSYSKSKIFSGGIVGYCRGYITNCYNRGDLTTNNGHYLAGITGILTSYDPDPPIASMSNCYSTAVFYNYNASYDRWLWASADYSSAVHITNCFWLPNSSNSNIKQPNTTDDTWGTQTYVSSITEAELQGTAEMTESNRSGTFSGYVVDNYLGALDLDNSEGAYGFGYASSGGYPILGWQLFSNFMVDVSGSIPAPVAHYSIAVSCSDNGTAAADPILVSSGESSTITITPDSGYRIGTITDNGMDVSASVSGNTYTIDNITANHTIVIAFTNDTYILTYAAGAHGSISGTTSQTVAKGTDGSAVTAVADSGYHFAGWTDDSTDNPRTDTNITNDILVKAIFLVDSTGTSPSDHFTIAVLPDTQFYSENCTAIFDQQTQWIADNAESQNIVFTAHLGDLVNVYNSSTQWQNARDSMAVIRAAGIPYSVVPGNHDMNYSTGDLTDYNEYFPYTDFSGYSWYGGHYPDDSNACNYELFSAMGQDFIILNLVSAPSLQNDDTANWANDVLTQYSNRQAIIVSHAYIDSSGSYLDASSVSGLYLWNNIVKLHSNVLAVLCGHESGEYYSLDTGSNGNIIYNLLTDYQDEDNGGNGWLRLYEFYPASNTIQAVTYSPYMDQYDTSAYGQFDLPLEFIMGDSNGDGAVDIGDVVTTVNFVLGKTAPSDIQSAASDYNSDGVIDIADVVSVVNGILGKD